MVSRDFDVFAIFLGVWALLSPPAVVWLAYLAAQPHWPASWIALLYLWLGASTLYSVVWLFAAFRVVILHRSRS